MAQRPAGPSAPKLPAAQTRRIIIALCGLAVVAALLLLGPQLTRLLAPPVPTPQCVEPTLTLGAAKFVIQSLARAADGSIAVPGDKPDVAYWVEGTNVNYVFGLSPTPNNLALKTTLKTGDEATIVWADCGTDEYVVKEIEAGQINDSTLFDQSSGGLSVFVQASLSSGGLIIRAGRPEAAIIDTPVPDENEIQAEMSFLDTTTSPDGVTVTIGVSILNTGKQAISLSESNISLTPENAAPLALVSVEPALPLEIKPGVSETFHMTFPRPATSTAVLKILSFSVDYYF